ncbi:calcium-binding protein [Conexibacter sp. SYSU D00693]|uniref:calcium-binding protein n=1 Tax=Conexibacter sp. SYSU D00693 TaxID=2812560 RepID=UPI00196BB2B3|nr:calcium-binding protein [Conexibacter sp. SYSU D00693]
MSCRAAEGLVPAALLALALALAPSAAGATVSASEPIDKYDNPRTVFEAAAGEVNDVIVSTSGTAVLFEDRRATVIAGEGCVQLDAHRASCPALSTPSVQLGDGDDVAAVVAGTMSVFGDTGADVLLGGAGQDQLDAGPGADVVRAGGGDDLLLTTGEAPDDLDGGVGTDVLQLVGGPMRLDLRAMTLQTTSVLTRVTGVESAIGGSPGSQVLLTDDDDRVCCLAPAIVLDGRAGDDRLEGAGTLVGGAGDDEVEASGPGTVDCGPGDDVVERVHAQALVGRSCERVRGKVDIRLPVLRARGGRVAVRLACPRRDGRTPCLYRVRAGGPTVALRIPAGRRATARVRARPRPTEVPLDVRVHHGEWTSVVRFRAAL